MLISLIGHASAGAALVVFAIPIAPLVPEPEPMAIIVEFVSEPNPRNEEAQEVRKGDPESVAPEDAALEQNDIEKPDETARAETFIKPEELPEKVPVPIRKPRPERRKLEEKAPDKTRLAKARGLEDEPRRDIILADELQLANDADASLAYAASRSVTRNVQAEQRWVGRLSAHLERRKRYPTSAQSRRLEGVVQFRFVVDPKGTIMGPELVLSSGVPELDEEVLDLMRRASPVPKPPSDVNPFVTVPIEFNIK